MPLDAYVKNHLPDMDKEGLAALVPDALSTFQHTLAGAVQYTGIGVHSGVQVSMRLLPAAPNSGIKFIRTDLPAGENEILAVYNTVVDTRLCTILGNQHNARVATVEHVLSALHGLGIDNAVIEVDNQEMPVADGSAMEFIKAIMQVGIVPQTAPRKVLEVLREVTVTKGDKVARLSPAKQPEYSVTIVYENQVIGTQTHTLALTPATYIRDVAAARTFGLLSEVQMMHSAGYAKGGSLDNAVVVDADRVLNPDGLRYEDEFVRHKILDAVGDIALAGGVVRGRLEGHKSGHELNNMVLHQLFSDPANYRWVDADADQETDAAMGSMTGNPMVLQSPVNRAQHAVA